MVVKGVRQSAQDTGHGTRATPDQVQFANAGSSYNKANPQHDNEPSLLETMKNMVMGTDEANNRDAHDKTRSSNELTVSDNADFSSSPRAHARPNSTRQVEQAVNNPHSRDREAVRPEPESGITSTQGSGIGDGSRGGVPQTGHNNNDPSMMQKAKHKITGDGNDDVSSTTGTRRDSDGHDTFTRNNTTTARGFDTVPVDKNTTSSGVEPTLTTEAASRAGHHSNNPMADYNTRSEMKNSHDRGSGTDGPMSSGIAATAAGAGTRTAVGNGGSNHDSMNKTAPTNMRNTSGSHLTSEGKSVPSIRNNASHVNPQHTSNNRQGSLSGSSMSSVSSSDDADLVTKKRNAHRRRAERGSTASHSSRSSISSASSGDDHTHTRGPVGAGDVIIPNNLDEAGGTPAFNKSVQKPSLVSQRAMALAGGQAALGVMDVGALSRSKVSFRKEIPIEVYGDKNPDAHVTCSHLLSQARKSHTLNALVPVQPSQILPSNSTLDKALVKVNKDMAKAHLRAEKNSAKETKRRDKEVGSIEKRLLKEIARYSKQMFEDEEVRNPVKRHSLEEWEQEAKRVKWPLISEYDRALSKSHLDAMKLIYRMRLLDCVSIFERMHASEWSELCEIENKEWHDLAKDVESDKKDVDKDTKWGITSKLTGHKKVDGVKLDKDELDDTANAKKRVLSFQNEAQVEKLRDEQMRRRASLSAAQEKTINTFVGTQSELMNNMRIHVLT
ncbi:hypothetical protein SARC_11273 [Sphaeroforma arctica JP610]|uniref:Uncharacterized protein n=1 Tax=Sphaeroforma arctica JP610 TaxID=667725 RepID=A0A0L0FHG3_9EUKA|nr:hypothetical protein SARC_11273 [Sphaeroforma arctica JP610]KNC76217.1 hypothetical protein SARC_11273 [Sphaeroforma arctica JP610]|eukprot:XP_014150119.1 hypothetical protein SARC_11273 [Sphaeroforma arctica JP610]